jgi:hypothetical protein
MGSAGLRLSAWPMAMVAVAMMIMGSASLAAQSAPKLARLQPPPMGWSSWNSFSNTVSSQVIVEQAKAMVSSGLKKAGYQYVNIDEGWWLGKRDAHGNIVVDPKMWPAIARGEHDGDMSNIVRYIHSLGLKAGIYTDAGRDGCGTFFPDVGPGYPGEGSEGHYEQDFLQFAMWGFDYVKVDWCGGNKENLDPAVQYAEIARAISRAEAITGHRLFYSICNWGKQSPWTWAPNIGGSPADIWRTSGDIVDPIVAGTKNAGRRASYKKMLSNFDQGIHPEAQHTGYYNDPDMMVIGMPGLTDEENRVHMSLWAISGAPLIVGADLTSLSDTTRSILTNPEVIAIDQDPLGLQAVKVQGNPNGIEVWSKRLARPGERAVLLLNRTDADAPIILSPVNVQWKNLGMTGSVSVHDPWTGKDLGKFADHYSTTVQRGDAVLLVVRGTEQRWTSITPGTDHSFALKATRCDQPVEPVQILYKSPGSKAAYAELRVDGQTPTRIAFPASGTASAVVWIQVNLDLPPAEGSKTNLLRFSPLSGEAPQIESIKVPRTGPCTPAPAETAIH